jgi:hypothetical protein
MNKVFFAAFFLLALLCTVSVGTVFAQSRVPGVSVGNEFTYGQISLWVSSDPNVSMFNGVADINMTQYYKVTVTVISGSNVSKHMKLHFTNGTDIETDGSVSTETTAYQGGFWAIIANNLNEKDRVHPNSEQDLSTINETMLWGYAVGPNQPGYQRQTNHLMLDFSNEESGIPNSTYTEHVSSYFDKQTVALVQLQDIHTYHNPDITLTVTWELFSQNAWTGSDTSQVPTLPVIILIVLVALAVFLLAALVYRKRRLARTSIP